MRVGQKNVGWAESVARRDADTTDARGPLAQSARAVGDGVDAARAVDPGADACATAAGRGRAAERARGLVGALVEARDELPPFRGDFGDFTAALTEACGACRGELRQVLQEALALRHEVASGMARISTG